MKPGYPFFCAAMLNIAVAPAIAAPDQAEVSGTWINPKGTVKVETGKCAENLCGWIVWADSQAAADARESGVDNLIGIKLLQDYHLVEPGQWQGRVYVPDMGGTYFSRIEQIDARSLKISGCILGGLICKSQIWHKADRP